MKKLFTIIAILGTTQGVVNSAPKAFPRYQTQIVFEDSEVPAFVVTEHKGKQSVVIDRSHLKSSVQVQKF